MKRLLLLLGFMCLVGVTVSQAKDSKKSESLQFKSVLVDQDMAPTKSAYPTAFTELNNPVTNAAITTGYYFCDNNTNAELNTPDYWKPAYDRLDTNVDRHLWKQIVTGPRQVDSTYWTLNPDGGWAFFRNPAVPGGGESYFKHGIPYGTDSSDNAIAGPIPLGLAGGFYFNGLRYDSFYVSTNGIIALTNRRYFYNNDGQVTIPPGSANAYDPMSMDWFARTRSGNGLQTDRLPDDYGYQYTVLGNAPNTATAGIRMNGSAAGLSALPAYAAVIAPFWGSYHLSQWNPYYNIPENYGRVYIKRSNAADKITIYYENLQPLGTMNVLGSSYNATKDCRQGSGQNYISADCEVILNRLDSSITMQYHDFRGVATLANGRSAVAEVVFQHTSTVGVRGYARHVNYARTGETYPWAGEYEQVTLYNNRITNVSRTLFSEGRTVKFKQWKNTLRVVDIQYRVRKQDATADLSFSDSITSTQANNYELLAGEERIGAIQPVVLMQNLTNDIQGPNGVNYTPQELNFQARFRIVNQASKETVYSSIIPITDSTLKYNVAGQIEKVRYSGVSRDAQGNYHGWPIAYPSTNNYDGIPPYGFVQIHFRPFEPSEIERRNHGRLRCFIIAEPYNPITKESLGDEWPFDDTTKVNIFVMTRLNTFKDDVTEFHYVDDVSIPSVYKWVSVGTEVVNGDDVSVYPLPPRGEFNSANIDPVTSEPYAQAKSPVILVDRLIDGNNPNPMPGGDQLRSFPINLANKANPVLTLSVQRGTQRPDEDWYRGYSDQRLIGPEPRVVVNFSTTTEWTNQTQSASRWTDYLKVEFAYPSPDGIRFITNIPDAKWTTHNKKSGGTLTGVSAYTLCGAGGFYYGFLPADKDSALTTAQGLVSDLYDDGFDWDYKKIYLPIPNYILNAPNNAARNFRFRVRCYATDYKEITQCMPCIPDDADPFYVDNVAIISNTEEADIEISSVRIKWPYTAVPASQALQVPISVRIANNTSLDSKSFLVRVVIERSTDPNVPGDTVYCNQKFLNVLRKGATYDLDMDYWNAARYSGAGNYVVKAQMYYLGNSVDWKDIDETNDKNYKQFKAVFSDVFAYEMEPNTAVNQVSEGRYTGIVGRGLNLFGNVSGGYGGQSNGYYGGYDNNVSIAGAIGGSGSGQIAVKFRLAQADTIYGFKAYFASLSQNNDNITLAVYADRNGLPGDLVEGTTIRRQRGLDDIRNNFFYDQFVTYEMDTPKLLNAGTYWVSIAQLGAYNLELGASASRMGMRTTNVYITPPITGSQQPLGDGGISLLLDKNLRKLNDQQNLVNENFFAFENSKGSGNWNPFMPTIGNPAYAHQDHFGKDNSAIGDGITYTLTRGTWIPMLRPYLGMKNVSTVQRVICGEIPIELTSFNGQARSNGIELYWETASESNNKGFYVERAISDANNPDWKSVAFVDGVGNSNTVQYYSYLDKAVQNNTTYLYRLRQIDNDGVQSCGSITDAVEVTFNYDGDVVLEQNAPNPFTESTKIYYRVVKSTEVKLEVVDLFGNVVRTLANGIQTAQLHEVTWNGDNESGEKVAAGTYIYRLTVGKDVKIGKMTLVR